MRSTRPFLPNAAIGDPLLGVERDERSPGNRDHARAALVAPIGDAAICRSPSRDRAVRLRRRTGLPLLQLLRHVRPLHVARRRMQREDRPVTGARVEQAVDHDRRHLVVGRDAHRPSSTPNVERHGRLPPGDAQLADVVRVDLIERRVFQVRVGAAIGAPFAIARDRAMHGHDRRDRGHRHQASQRSNTACVHIVPGIAARPSLPS